MRISQDIADGIYDNQRVFARERWEGGRLCGRIDAKLIVEQAKRGAPFEPWGHYPDPYMISGSVDVKEDNHRRLVSSSRREELAREFLALNPDMTICEAVDEADMWIGYLNSPFHLLKRGCASQMSEH